MKKLRLRVGKLAISLGHLAQAVGISTSCLPAFPRKVPSLFPKPWWPLGEMEAGEKEMRCAGQLSQEVCTLRTAAQPVHTRPLECSPGLPALWQAVEVPRACWAPSTDWLLGRTSHIRSLVTGRFLPAAPFSLEFPASEAMSPALIRHL